MTARPPVAGMPFALAGGLPPVLPAPAVEASGARFD